MLFAGIDHDFAIVLEQINVQWPGSRSSVARPMVNVITHPLCGRFARPVLLSGDNFHAVSGVAKSVSTNVAESIRTSVNDAVQRLAGSGGDGGAPSLCITMPDGLTVSGSAALNALQAR